MVDNLAAARRLYAAFAARDPRAILESLHPAFVGEVSAGMPLGLGGTYEGPEAMLSQVWGPVARVYDLTPELGELLACGTDRVVAVGTYRGALRDSGAPVDAAFAHVLTMRESRVARLVQITDTARWPAPGT